MTTDQPGRKGSGTVMTIEPGNPGAGANTIMAVPAGTRWRIMSFHYDLLADGTVINRNMGYSIHPVSGLMTMWLYNNMVIAAGGTGHLNVMAGANVELAMLIPTYATLSMPEFYLDAGFWIQSQVVNLQPGDQIMAPVLTLERWAIG